MAATKALLVPLLSLVVLSSSCRSVIDDGDKVPVVLPGAAVGLFEGGEFERLAAHPQIRRLASPRTVVVVWCESISEWIRVKALRVPAGKTVSDTLGIPAGQKLSSSYGQLHALMPIAFNGISSVTILHEKQWRTIDGNVAVGSEEETEHHPILHPGTIVFVEEAPLETPPWFNVK